MYSINYHLNNAYDQYFEMIHDYPVFYTILIAMAILGVVFIANLESGSNNFKVTLAIEVLCVFFTLYHFGLDLFNHLDSSLNSNFLNNICFFFINANVCLAIVGSVFSASDMDYAFKFILSICYLLVLANLIFALYISYAINAEIFITVGNIAPMILIGNVLAIGVYIVLAILLCTDRIRKQYAKKEHMLYR